MIELVAVAFPILLAAIIGYVLGVLRDASKANAERKARHQDAVLEASAQVLDASATLAKTHQSLAYTVWEMVQDRQRENREYREHLEERRQEAFADLREATAAAQPHLMKLSILAPGLDKMASHMLFAARRSGNDTEAWTEQAEAHAEDTRAFQTAVQEHLRITGPKSRRRWRPWIGKPIQWASGALRWVRGLFLE